MNVVDHEYHSWFLFEDDGTFFLDVNCNHSAFGYSWLVKLNAAESEQFQIEGRDYLNKLAHGIHFSAPFVRGSKSRFKDRDVSKEFSDATTEAVRRWKSEPPPTNESQD